MSPYPYFKSRGTCPPVHPMIDAHAWQHGRRDVTAQCLVNQTRAESLLANRARIAAWGSRTGRLAHCLWLSLTKEACILASIQASLVWRTDHQPLIHFNWTPLNANSAAPAWPHSFVAAYDELKTLRHAPSTDAAGSLALKAGLISRGTYSKSGPVSVQQK